ncbi:MAG: YkgJ family cysteine cluster protein [Planctomycetota bacterium]|nr:YkgJ family cysteine cluster protein [Planctomycetota bacterium]
MSQSIYYRALERAQELLAETQQATGTERARHLRTWVDRQSAAQATSAQWDCRVGCTHCCRHPVGVTFPEAQLLAAAIRALPAREREAITGRVFASARATTQTPWEGLTDQACPLLDEHGACSLYAERPIPCRALGSLDASACEDPGRHARIPFDEPAFLAGLAAGSLVAGEVGHRELRSGLAAVLQASNEAAREAFAAARRVGEATGSSHPKGQAESAGDST